MKDFNGKSVLITGGARGIGLATARLFISLGADVTIGALHQSSVDRAAGELRAGDRLATVAADVGTVAGARATVAAAEDAFGRIDVLFANAGGYESAPVEEMTEALWDRTIDVHLKGMFFCVQAALEGLLEARGVVVAMASDAGLAALRGGWSAYCAAMGGVVNLTRQLAVDLAPEVRVNAVAPGPVGTDHLYRDLQGGSYGGMEATTDPREAIVDSMPLRRIVAPEEVAEAVAFIVRAKSMTGTVISLDGGNTAAIP